MRQEATTVSAMLFGGQQLVSYSGVRFQPANMPKKASWKLAPRVRSRLSLPLALVDSARMGVDNCASRTSVARPNETTIFGSQDV